MCHYAYHATRLWLSADASEREGSAANGDERLHPFVDDDLDVSSFIDDGEGLPAFANEESDVELEVFEFDD